MFSGQEPTQDQNPQHEQKSADLVSIPAIASELIIDSEKLIDHDEEKKPSVPEEFRCPILTTIMLNPVVAEDGNTYERDAIEKWFKEHNTSPLTGEVMPSKRLIPNHAVRKMIEDFIKNHSEFKNERHVSAPAPIRNQLPELKEPLDLDQGDLPLAAREPIVGNWARYDVLERRLLEDFFRRNPGLGARDHDLFPPLALALNQDENEEKLHRQEGVCARITNVGRRVYSFFPSSESIVGLMTNFLAFSEMTSRAVAATAMVSLVTNLMLSEKKEEEDRENNEFFFDENNRLHVRRNKGDLRRR